MRNKAPHVIVVSLLDGVAHLSEGAMGFFHRYFATAGPLGAGLVDEVTVAVASLTFWVAILHVIPSICRFVRGLMDLIMRAYEAVGRCADNAVLATKRGALRALQAGIDWLNCEEVSD